ncbi:MAG: hypothetical protein JSR17_03410 [Proteobacteria bacterium]|nr:hypothetical protein [Pseudomonadota bacterium]
MKRYKAKQMMSVMMLVGAFMAPALTYADAEDVAAINGLKASNEGNFSTINNSLSPLQNIQTNTQNINDFLNAHVKNDEYFQALLNYEAAARFNELQYNQQLLYMAAPGSIWAVSAGGIVGKTKVGDAAKKLVNTSILTSIKGYSTASNYSGPMANGTPTSSIDLIPSGTVLTKDVLYDKYVSPFVTSGDTTGLTVINFGQFLQTPNLSKAKIAPEQSEQMISLITTPFPTVDPTIKDQISGAKLNPSGLTGASKEGIVDAMVENAIVSVSVSALGDIVARRTPALDSNGNPIDSVMEAMDNYSSQRFTNPAWYEQISASSDTALLRELAHMQAYSSYMQFQQFRVLEQQMALLATMNAVMAKMNTNMDKLNVQMQKAAAQAAQASQNLQNATSAKCGSNQYPDANGNCVDIPKAP